MIHQLVYLNPSIEKEYIFSFLFYVNNNHAKPKMNMKELVRLFNFVYDIYRGMCPRLNGYLVKIDYFIKKYVKIKKM